MTRADSFYDYKSEFWHNGYEDYHDDTDSNPYPVGTAAHDEWAEGWNQANTDEIAEEPDYDYPEDQYWSGTGELIGDESYINYLNNN